MSWLPNSTELSEEQKSIYEDDLDKILFITGPPGTGKTVIAILRAERMAKNNDEVNLYMFNNTLKEYTKKQVSNELKRQDSIKTLYKDIFSIWRNALRRKLPRLDRVDSKSIFWNNAYHDVKGIDDIQILNRLFKRQIIIDEGQDFPPELYKMLALYWGKLKKEDINFVPTVLADENQKLNEDGSTLKEIRKELSALTVANFREKLLDQNYRNTKEIAKFAAKFYAGAPTGMPSDKNCRDGQKPVLFWHDQHSLIKKIVQFKINNPQTNIGIIVTNKFSVEIVKKIFNDLQKEIKKRKEDSILLQKYHHGESEETLNFIKKNSITVLTKESAKGLEFDCVFIPRINLSLDENNLTPDAMAHYTMFHRARDFLFIGCEVEDINDESVFELPKLLSSSLTVNDYKSMPIEIGFKNKDELALYCEIEEAPTKKTENHQKIIETLKKLKEQNNSQIKIKTDKRITAKKSQRIANKKLKKDKEEIEKRKFQKDMIKSFIAEAQNNENDKDKFNELIQECHPDDELELKKLFKERIKHIEDAQKHASEITKLRKKAKEKSNINFKNGKTEISKILGHGTFNDFVSEKVWKHLYQEGNDYLQVWSIKKPAKRLIMRVKSHLERKKGIYREVLIDSEENSIILNSADGKSKKIIIHSYDNFDNIKTGNIIVVGADDINENDDLKRYKTSFLDLINSNKENSYVYFCIRDYADEPTGVKIINEIIERLNKALIIENKLFKDYEF